MTGRTLERILNPIAEDDSTSHGGISFGLDPSPAIASSRKVENIKKTTTSKKTLSGDDSESASGSGSSASKSADSKTSSGEISGMSELSRVEMSLYALSDGELLLGILMTSS